MILEGRIINKGDVEGKAIVTNQQIGFYGGVDPKTGVVIEEGHELKGQNISGKILVFPNSKGSTVGSYVIYGLAKNKNAPLAIINAETETIVATGVILGDIACIDKIDISKIKTGDNIKIRENKIYVNE